jgi:SagB-type dehydrogenase family enzyme
MKKLIFTSVLAMVFAGGLLIAMVFESFNNDELAIAEEKVSKTENIKLPAAKYDGVVSVEKALLGRRSIRTYKEEPLALSDVSQILWAAQGITDPKTGHRTAPSAMARYFLEVYLIPGNVTGLPMGIYKYQPQGHELVVIAEGDYKSKLFEAAGQAPIKNAPAALVICGMSERSTNPNWMYLEAGHAAQNVYLQAVSLKLGTVVMGGFKGEEVRKALNISAKEQPIYIMPVGKK